MSIFARLSHQKVIPIQQSPSSMNLYESVDDDDANEKDGDRDDNDEGNLLHSCC